MVPSIAMQTTFKSSVNPDHVEALKQLMRETCTHLDMHLFFSSRTGGQLIGQILDELKDPKCGTTACIAGYAVVCYLGPSASKPSDVNNIIDLALEYLGVTKEPLLALGLNPVWLFFAQHWPLELEARYENAVFVSNPVEAVEVACEAIDRYIAQYQEAELAYAAIGGAL